MSECFPQSKATFARNEKGLAKELSLKGLAHKANMALLDKEASAKIFQGMKLASEVCSNMITLIENNERSSPNTVDLHGLYVTEAKFYFKRTVEEVRDREQPLCVIVGKGIHSDGNIPKIKPAIQALGESLGMIVDVDPENDGCLIVSFN
ncbi:hypothetical protein K503DRAFT_536712 [Rhizopogon vinicolor AM-OR11-026]|uniref:Smr domain-containing protein n=1 Tax=Rhizopogon vinicolor AM-OR11-026 TaxID=1314800 RepID=A0A1B7MKZ2_9AGAM|nr:hypothetical protein K503DRAFT_536712 [Rhizopogon vinicolor AM-OR11-026]